MTRSVDPSIIPDPAAAFAQFKSLVRRRHIKTNLDALVALLTTGPVLDQNFRPAHARLWVGQIQYGPKERALWHQIERRCLYVLRPTINDAFGTKVPRTKRMRAAVAWRTYIFISSLCHAAQKPPVKLAIRGSEAITESTDAVQSLAS